MLSLWHDIAGNNAKDPTASEAATTLLRKTVKASDPHAPSPQIAGVPGKEAAAATAIQAIHRGKLARVAADYRSEYAFRHSTLRDSLSVNPTIDHVPTDDEWGSDKLTALHLRNASNQEVWRV